MILNNISDIKIGSADVDKVYLGSALVWQRDSSYVILPKSVWEQGGIGSQGNEYSNSQRCRARGYYPVGNYSTIRAIIYGNFTGDVKWCVQGYRYTGGRYISDTSYEGPWVTNAGSYNFSSLVTGGVTHFRLSIKYSRSSSIDVNDVNYAKLFFT